MPTNVVGAFSRSPFLGWHVPVHKMPKLGTSVSQKCATPPAEAHWAPQRAYYHVTDKASLVGCNAATAFEVLRALRRGDLHPDWRIFTLPTQPGHEPYSVAGEVKVHG